MELRHLQHFIAVAEELSFTNAARRIHIVQSALSASVRSLERDLGTELFKRTGHSVLLTESGKVLLIEARKVADAVEAAQDAVAAVEGGLRGRVRVGILQSLALGDLVDVLVGFHSRRPHVRIEARVEPAGSEELVKLVQTGQLDVAFAGLPEDGYPSDVDVVALSRETLALAVPTNHRLYGKDCIDLVDLDGESFVDYPAGWGIRRSVNQLFADRGLSRQVVVEVADCRTAFELAVAGLGVAFVIPSTVGRNAMLHQVTPAVPFEVSIITATEPRPRAATRAFIDLVRGHFDRRALRP